MVFLYGYSGCGKTTVAHRFASTYTNIYIIQTTASDSPLLLLKSMANKLKIEVPDRISTATDALSKHLRQAKSPMFIFDEFDKINNDYAKKLQILRIMHEDIKIPFAFCGTFSIYHAITRESSRLKFEQFLTRCDEYHMRGMKKPDAARYLETFSEQQSVSFTFQARQILEDIAIDENVGGIKTFMLIISRCVTWKRMGHYLSENNSAPEIVLPDKSEEGIMPLANLFSPPSTTPVVLQIEARDIDETLHNYKSRWKSEGYY